MARLQPTLSGLFVAGTLGCLTVALGTVVFADEPVASGRPPLAASEEVRPLPPVDPANPLPLSPELLGEDLSRQTDAAAARKSHGCVTCHIGVGDMHRSENVRLGCTDCHGGNADCLTKQGAHVHPKEPESWPGSANPVRSYTLLNHESPEFVRFVNPGDLRAAPESCGGCHASIVLQVQKSMMTHGCMLWNAALYNNGSIPNKRAAYGESYSHEGIGQRLQTVPPPTEDEINYKSVMRYLDPLPRFERQQPSNVLRFFERGGRFRPEVGNPERIKEIYRGADRKTPAQIRIEEAMVAHERNGLPVHMLDIHMERGMHCIDCHFIQDMHGNTKLYGEVRAAIEITCIDCHGTTDRYATLRTSGPASDTSSPEGGRDLRTLRTPSGKRRFVVQGERVYQNSMVEENLTWEIKQTKATVDPQSEHYNVLSAFAKTVRRADDGAVEWGGSTRPEACAHRDNLMSCISCHSAWNPSCFGCHLPQKVNKKSPGLHYEGDVSRNYVAYNVQTLRDDVFMLARDGNATGNRIGPARSSCAIHVGSFNANRESIYAQQQTISAEGYSGIAFSTNVPHTVRGGPHSSVPRDLTAHRPGTHETKMCTDCHVSKQDDNNAIMAQLLMQGTNYTNFIGRYCWVGLGSGGLAGVVVTEQQEPQAVIGSSFHKIAFPDDFGKHLANQGVLQKSHHHATADAVSLALNPLKRREVLQVQMRGEYLYAACGADGLRVFDIAFIDDKAFSQRITTAPVSPLGQQFYVKTAYATGVASPSTTAPDPTRTHDPANFEGTVHAMYGYLYVSDLEEGLVMVGAGTLLDGNPLNNFLKRDVTFNPDGILKGARSITIAGTNAWICCNAGIVVVSIEDPTCPKIVSVIGSPNVIRPTSVEIQFRNAFVCDAEGLKTFDITDPAAAVPLATVPLATANKVYVARTYAYVAAGQQGLVIVDVTNPHAPFIDQCFDADGKMNDVRDVKLGITYVSEFAYVADGANGLRVVQLTGPETPGNVGFSPRPTPQLVASYPVTKGGMALSVSEGVDRDRAVDESGNQLSVFGRVGAKPLDLESQQRMYLNKGRLWKVSDNPFDLELYRPLR